MGSDTNIEKLPPVNGAASPEEEVEEKTIGGKASPDEIYLIDRACLELRVKRGPFIVEAAVERARTVMAARASLDSVVAD
jgi:uncharacterized protein (DUF1778 family)